MLKKSLLLMLLMTLLVPWAANAQGTLTVCEGMTQNQFIPFYAYSGDTQGTTSEFIIPASTLTELNGKEVTALKFYLAQSQSKTWTANYQIYMAVVDYTTLSSNIGPDAGTIVYQGTVDASGSEMTITFNQGNYTYNGGNLLIGTYVATGGAYDSNGKFYGIEAEDAAYLSGDWGGYSTGPQDFIPQTTFIYLTDDPYITLDPASATVFTGFTATLTATYGNVTDTPTITYSSSNPKIASVSGSGTSATVTGESVGTATITATMNGLYTATCAITVEDPSYCTPYFSQTSDYIQSFVTTGGETNINNTNTGQGTGGYSNFYSEYSASITAGETLSFTVTRGYNDSYKYAIWVDWNHDYVFDVNTETVASVTSPQKADWEGSFTIPDGIASGDYCMRVEMLYGSSNTLNPCVSASYGEVEDYKLTVFAANPYLKPTDLTVTNLGPFNATIGWTAPSTDVVNYQYQYMPDGGDWTALTTTTALNAPLTGLTDETDYTFRVKAIYAGGESDFATKEFTTTVACETPTNLTATDITDDGATLGWTSDADNFNIRYRTAAIEPLTFFDDFESGISQWTTVANDYSGTGTNWKVFNVDNFGDPNLTNHSGSYVAMSRSYDGSDHSVDNWLITPQVTLDGTLKFWAINDDGGGYAEHYSIYVSTTGNDVADFTEIYVPDDCTAWTEFTVDLTSYNGVPGYIAIRHLDAEKDFLFIDDFGIYGTATPAGDWKYTTSNTNSKTIGGLNEMTLYDFEVQTVCGGIYGESDWAAGTFETLPSCMPISDLDVAVKTTTTVTLIWTDNNGGSATYVVTDGEDNPVTVTGLTTTGCTVTGLIANTAYTFKVKADCGSGYSTAVTIDNVRTDCNLITTFPYEEGFEDDGQYCWTFSSFGIATAQYAHAGNYCAFAPGSYTTPAHLVLPEMGEDISGLMLNFWYNNLNAGIDCGTLYVGYITDEYDYSTFVTVGTIDMSNGIGAYELTNYFTFVGAPAGSRMVLQYVGSGETYAYVLIDDVTVDVLPACMPPYGLEVDNASITAHGATFSWTSNGSETEWHLYFSTENTAPANDINLKEVYVADSNPFTLTTGLDPETNYYVWVRASCGGDDGYSSWVGPATFTTDVACPVPTDLVVSDITGHEATLSWTGDTDVNYFVDYRTAATLADVTTEDFSTDPTTSGWILRQGALNTDGTATLSTGNSWSRGNNCGVFDTHMYMNLYSTKNYWLITPSMDIPDNYALSFDLAYTKYSSSSSTNTAPVTGCTSHRFAVLISTDEMEHWTILREWNNSGSEYVLDEVSQHGQNTGNIDLSEYAKSTAYIAFFAHSETTSFDNNMHFDNVSFGTVVPAGAWVEITANTNSRQLNGLFAETKYEAKVQKDCDPVGTSDWSDIISFTTDIACYPATGLAYDNLKSNRVDLTWTSEADAWVLAYKLDTDADFTEIDLTSSDVTVEGTTVTYQLTGLTAEKEYDVKVRNNCGGGDLSAWTNVITFETLAACAQPTDVTVSNVGHFTADVAWTGDSEYYIVQYRTAATIDAAFTEEFNTSSIPTGWARYNTALTDDVLNGTTALTSYSGGWSNNSYGLGAYNWKVNLWGNSCKYWMVTPSIAVGDDNSLSFDMAITGYNNSNAPETAKMADANSRFVVLITDDDMATWTILREWNNSGSEYVLNNISNTGTSASIDLTAYAKSSVKIAFYCEQLVSGPDCDFHIDNVIVGATVPAGSWQTLSPNPTTTAATLTGLSIGTKYDVTVAPSCDATLVSDAATFTTLADMIFITEGEWGNETNWLDNLMPTIDDNVQLQANATIASTDVAEADKITLNGKTLTINDGGQLKINNSVTATVKKNISHYNYSGDPVDPEHPADGYNLIANPVGTIYSYNVSNTGMLAGTYDLYNWIYSTDHEWQNFRNTTFALNNGTGYLYANSDDVELTFAGSIKANNVDEVKPLNYASSGDYEFNGWNLVGNPFMCNAYITNVSGEVAFYRMNENGDGFVTATGAIAPMEGIFVQATESGQSFTFTRTNPDTDNGTGNLNISVAQNVNSRDAHASTDNAIVRFGNANTLEKFSFRENSTKMYIPQDSKKYAVVSAEASGTLPLNLKVEKTGSYTISFSNEDVEFTYLHLIDGITGEDIDLLVEGSYTFNASVRDRENRFTLVFNSIDSNIDATSDIFVYQNDDQIVVSGEGELQVYDVMGRFVGSYNVNGTETLNASQFANNVYIFRLVGETVKTQKIVVR